jgi:hypothetical protein
MMAKNHCSHHGVRWAPAQHLQDVLANTYSVCGVALHFWLHGVQLCHQKVLGGRKLWLCNHLKYQVDDQRYGM